MREYGKVSPQFWTGATGKEIRKTGRDAQLVALYLLTCPNSNWIGLYYMPLPTLCHETGLKPEGAWKALRSLSEAQFAYFDDASEHVFVVEMAAHQIGGPLSKNDKRAKGIAKDWLAYSKSPFFMDFYRRYKDWYHLELPPDIPSPIEAPSKPHRSQEQEQEQEQEYINLLPSEEGCSEPFSGSEQSPCFVMVFPCVGKGPNSWGLSESKLAEYRETFPGVDVLSECRKALQWCVDNPSRRKTARGMPAFLNRWLERAQNSGAVGTSRNNHAQPKRDPLEGVVL